MNKYDNQATALEALLYHKKPDCVDALSREFNQAISEGFSPRESYWRAEAVHFLKDHDGYNNLPELTIPATYDDVKKAILSEVRPGNEEDAAISALVLKWFELLLHWNIPVALAFATATQAGAEEWDEGHDLDEAEAIRLLNKLPVEELKDKALTLFYTQRNLGNTVRTSIRFTKDAIKEEMMMAMLFSALGAGLGGGNISLS